LHVAHVERRVGGGRTIRRTRTVLARREGEGEQREQDHRFFFPCGAFSAGPGWAAGALPCPGVTGGSEAISRRSFASRATAVSLGYSWATRSSCWRASGFPCTSASRATW